jgi:hypothetical protein
MGGFGVASLTGAILSYKHYKVSYWKLFFTYLVVAICWELYEYVRNIMNYSDWSGWYDTFKDLFDGFIGMSIAYFFVKK